ncbi:MAG: hypothetical protein WBZ36_08320, partial [Candidatus Nitrosopolaris sp.]
YRTVSWALLENFLDRDCLMNQSGNMSLLLTAKQLLVVENGRIRQLVNSSPVQTLWDAIFIIIHIIGKESPYY